MVKFIKAHKKIALLGSLITLSLTSAIVASVAWFQVEGRDTITDIRIPSGVIANYFEGKKISESETHFGDGTQADPFIIARPEQLFNLMELMKSDDAKMTSDSSVFYLNSYYFQFGIDYGSGPMFYEYTDEGTLANNSATPTSKVLNMKYYSNNGMLSPIGSPSHPFIGHIEGHNLTVDNITIDGTKCSDVGVFGYIASPGTVSNLYFDHLNIDVGISDLTGQSTGSHASHTHTSASVGYIVGHVYDANDALSNVYVNNCSISNQSAGNKAVSNNFGYIGQSDANQIQGESSETDISLKASAVHNYLSNSYDTIKDYDFATYRDTTNPAVATRDAGYSVSAGTKVSTKITKNNNEYSFTGPSNSASLSTAGYTSNEIELKDVRFEKNSTCYRLDPSTQVLSTMPDINPETSTLSDGSYIYYDDSLEDDDTKSNWRYLEVETSHGIITTVQLNCFYLTYQSGGNTYYAVYNNGNLVGTQTSPDSVAANQRPNYYFCLRQSVGSYGVSSYSTSNAQTTFHIYSPANDKYLNASTFGVSSSFSFVSNFSSSLEFVQQGNGNAVSVNGNDQYAFLTNGTSITLKRYVSTDGDKSSILFVGTESAETQPSYASDFDLVTDVSTLEANDIITFVRNDDSTYRAISDQAKNNRLTTIVTVTGTGNSRKITASNATKLSSFLLEGDSTKWEFKDINTNQYLYAAGQKSSGANYLKSQDVNNSNGQWTITLNGNHEATVTSVGNRYVPYLDFISGSNNDGEYNIFRAFRSASQKPLIFRRGQATSDPTYVYPSFKFEVSTTTSSLPSIEQYNLRYNDVGVNIDSSSPLVDDSGAVFIISTSQVTLPKSSNRYELITNINNLSVGDTIVIGNGVSGSVSFLSTTQNNNNRSATSSITVTNGRIDADNMPSNAESITLGQSNEHWTLYANETSGYLYAASSSNNYLRTQASNNANGEWAISVTANGVASITAQGSNTHNQLKNNGSLFSCYSSGQTAVAIYKLVGGPSDPETTFIGDQIGSGYNPKYIDAVGAYTSSATAMTFASSSAASAPALNNKFHGPSLSASSIVYAEYNGSMDLGRIDIHYAQTSDNSLKVNKNGGLKSLEADLGVSNDGDSTNHINTLYITTNNINNFALCALDANGIVVATFNSSGAVTGSVENAKYFVIDFRANGGSVSISEIDYSFTQLPGNNGNFGHVGYRSADYTSSTYTSGVWTQSTPTHATTSTILNYYFNTDADVYSYIYVSFDPNNMQYNITAYCTQNSELYLFNYDPTVYTVYVNGTRVLAGSNIVHINATQYDFETGWAV